MIPISDDNPTMRTPIVTIAILIALLVVWLVVQGGGFDARALAVSVCNLGLIPGEVSLRAAPGSQVPLGPGLACVVDRDSLNWLTPLTSMFLHGSWSHLLGNALFLWVFGNNIEDSTGRVRFALFYVLCGIAAAFTQVVVDPSSAVPMVGASGAISGVMGAYLVLYPRVRVNMLFFLFIFIRVIPVPAWMVLLWWFGLQVLSGLPSVAGAGGGVHAGVAFWAHIGGFVAGVALIKLFENPSLYNTRRAAPRRARSRWAR